MEKPTILLTGATGFLGSHLLAGLLCTGYKVVILKRSTSNVWRIAHLLNQVRSYDVDIEPLEHAFEQQRIDVVINTVCHYGRAGESMYKIVDANLMFGVRLLDACLAFNANAYINTDTLLQKFLNVYSLSKKQLTELLKQQSSRIKVVNLRLEHMYGPKDDVTKFVPWVLSQLKGGVSEIKLTLGEQKRDFIYIDDVVSAYLKVIENLHQQAGFSEFDVGTGKLTSVRDFLEQLKLVYESYFGVSNTQLVFGAIPYRDGEMMEVDLSNAALLDLGWLPKIELSAGLHQQIKDMK